MHGLGKEVRKMADTYRSKVYTERPAYADYDSVSSGL